MGLSNFHGPADGVLPLLLMNTVLSVVLLKNMVRSMLQVVGATNGDSSSFDDHSASTSRNGEFDEKSSETCTTRVLSCKYGSKKRCSIEECCCVCLCRFEGDEEVSELCYCQHFFHKACLEKWFDNQHTTCPLCRSVL